MAIQFHDLGTGEIVASFPNVPAVPRSNEHVKIAGLDYQVVRVSWEIHTPPPSAFSPTLDYIAHVWLVPP